MTRGILMTGAVLAALGISAVAASAHGYWRGVERAQMTFQSLDADGDGRLTAEEMSANRAARFAAADADGDGLLSADEMRAAQEAQRMARAERIIARMDADGDGLLSLQEIGARRDPAWMFDRMDADEDGVISAEEFEAMRGKARGWGHMHHGQDLGMDHGGYHAEE